MKPRFKLDENLPSWAGELLRDEGYDVETVLSEQLGGAVDSVILDACRAEMRVLVTLDLDFTDIRAYPPKNHHGIWVLRPDQQSLHSILGLLRGAAKLLATEVPDARLWIVESQRIRIRE